MPPRFIEHVYTICGCSPSSPHLESISCLNERALLLCSGFTYVYYVFPFSAATDYLFSSCDSSFSGEAGHQLFHSILLLLQMGTSTPRKELTSTQTLGKILYSFISIWEAAFLMHRAKTQAIREWPNYLSQAECACYGNFGCFLLVILESQMHPGLGFLTTYILRTCLPVLLWKIHDSISLMSELYYWWLKFAAV